MITFFRERNTMEECKDRPVATFLFIPVIRIDFFLQIRYHYIIVI